MSVSERAEIEASLTGLPAVLAGLQALAKELGSVGATLNDKLGGAPKKVIENLKAVTTEGLRAAGVLGKISLGKAVDEAKRFDQTTTHLSLNAKTSVTDLQSRFKGLEGRILTSAPAIAELTAQLGRATYSGKDAAAAVLGLGLEAAATGRTLQDELPLGETLRSDLGVVGDTVAELDRLRAIAEKVGTVGGHIALQDTLIALGPLLANVDTKSDAARAKLEGLVAVLGKGLKPGQATSAAASALSQLRSRALDIERATGKQVLNDNGEIIDPTETLRDLKRRSDKIHGGNLAEQRRALISTYGIDLGLAIFRTNLDEVDTAAKQRGAGKTVEAAEAYTQSTAGQRQQTELAKDSAQRSVGEKLLGVQDALVSSLGANTTAVLELTTSLATGVNVLKLLTGGSGAAKLASAASGAAAGGSSAAGAVAGAAGGAVAAAALPLTLLAGVGYLGYRDITSQEADYEKGRAQQKRAEFDASLIGVDAKTAFQLKARGLDFSAQPSQPLEEYKPTIEQLARVEAAIKAQPEAFAAAIRAAPPIIRPQSSPNTPKGN